MGETGRIAYTWVDHAVRTRREDGIMQGTNGGEQMENRLRLLESIIDHANDAILVTEAEPVEEPGPRIVYVNGAFTRMTGYALEDVKGKTPRILQGPDTAREPRDKIAAALKRWRPVRVELMNYAKDGTPFWVELNIVPVANENGWYTHWVSVQRDTTERRHAEQALVDAKEEAERANRAKSEFLSRMSHELRTPMNSILGFAQLLESDPAEPLTESQQESVEVILKGGYHLLDLINEVLDLARIESGRLLLALENVDVSSVMQEVVSLVRPQAEQRGIRFVDRGACRGRSVLADHTRLKQVLLNLLSNAVKYNCEGGTVTLSCEGTAGSRLRIGVADTGPGIPEEQRTALFEPFQRLEAHKTEVEGTGIGLTITKRLVELMDGAITVESAPGRGSRFSIELPVSEGVPDGQKEEAEASQEPDGGKPTVLYVEDNTDNLNLVSRILKRRPGVRLLSAPQAQLGLDLARAHRPDLILMDISLPGMDGYEALERLRDFEETRDIPVVALSSNAMPHDVKRGMSAGFTKYLTKPLNVREFFEVVDAVIGTLPWEEAPDDVGSTRG